MINYRENNYNLDITTTTDDNGVTTTTDVDLNSKFKILESHDKVSKFFYIRSNNVAKKRRFGRSRTKQQALAEIQEVRQQLLHQHYPTLMKK